MSKLVSRVLHKTYTVLLEKRVDIRLDRGMVSFTFDDFPLDALHTGGSILEDAGWRGTYYAATGLLGTKGSCGRMAETNDLQDCVKRGHEVANHTQSHLNCVLAERSVLVHEIEENQRVLPESAHTTLIRRRGSSQLVRRGARLSRGMASRGRTIRMLGTRGCSEDHPRGGTLYRSRAGRDEEIATSNFLPGGIDARITIPDGMQRPF